MSLPQKQGQTGQAAQQQAQSQNTVPPQQMQGFPFMQQQPQQQQFPMQMQGFPQMQQQQQQFPTQIQGFPQMQQQQQMPYTMQGNNCANIASSIPFPTNMISNKPSKKGFNLVQFPSAEKPTEEGKKEETKLKLAAVIVTICDGSTYDSLFSTVKQDAGDGSRVAVYCCSETDIKDLVSQLTKFSASKLHKRTDDLHLLLKDLEEIEDSTCVAINYECCSGCSDNGFTKTSNKQIVEELEFFLSKKYLIMYSDFSLKALIYAWDNVGSKTKLGPNPLVRTGSCSSRVTLNFNPYTLKTCISSQLQSVGELCPDQHHCTVHCMSNTIQYSIDKKYTETKQQLPYSIEILTIAQCDKHANSLSIQVPDFVNVKKCADTDKKANELDKDIAATKLPMKTLFGDAGHVVLDYEGSGGKLSGKILLSMTHWSELVKLGDNVTDDVLFQVAAKNLGKGSAQYQQMEAVYQTMGGKNASDAQKMQQQQWISQQANMMVQQQAPCNNMMNSNVGYFSKKGNY